jgi:hypothetical protein
VDTRKHAQKKVVCFACVYLSLRHAHEPCALEVRLLAGQEVHADNTPGQRREQGFVGKGARRLEHEAGSHVQRPENHPEAHASGIVGKRAKNDHEGEDHVQTVEELERLIIIF